MSDLPDGKSDEVEDDDADAAVEADDETSGYRPPQTTIGSWIVLACVTVLIILVVQEFFFKGYRIPSNSMFPTLRVGDHILVNKLTYGYELPGIDGPLLQIRSPQRGDIIVFRMSAGKSKAARYFVKRIVGLPGDVVELRKDRTLVNGYEIFEDNYITIRPAIEALRSAPANYGPVKIGSEEYFVLGDNRTNSQDSRVFGPVPLEAIEGRAVLIYWSWKQQADGSFRKRWDRVGKVVK